MYPIGQNLDGWGTQSSVLSEKNVGFCAFSFLSDVYALVLNLIVLIPGPSILVSIFALLGQLSLS